MSNINYDYIEEYIRSVIPRKTDNLFKLRNFAIEHNVPIVEEETEEFIKFLISIKKPEKMLELGTAIGYSAISFTKSSDSIKNFTTIEIKNEMVEIARKNIEEEQLNSIIKVIEGDAAEVINELEDSFDIIFIDAAKGQYEKYFNLVLKNLNEDGIIICDNVLYKGMIANEELVNKRKKTIVKRLRNFLNKISKNKEYQSSIVPIGDGVLLVRRSN
ncbi:O-methyltransferase [Anaerosphaera multitolerans]|uniref:tRNA 5-hydroxyuridine methyltransferase n=1 Tax=Anaerosphaera multitolerans TaxID=2487351 RepID=A0A437S816_9FIRM|nr:O-methyltransferase [Anaerosphaera multitolerans]RVU55229.1 O-methyltransferase [Anaerosphaera multitolerans]